MDLTEIGRTGRPHGTRGEIALHVDSVFEVDLLQSKAVLIGDPPIPYFVRDFRTGGKLTVRLENFDTREKVVLLSNRPLFLPADKVSGQPDAEGTPWDHLVGHRIIAEGYPLLGPIVDIVDLPEHYLAEIEHDGKTVYIPLHSDLILEEKEKDREVTMRLPEGLLELGS